MAFEKKVWIDRQTEFPARRKLTPAGEADVYDVGREEGLVIEPGDALNASNLNDLENRIAAAVPLTLTHSKTGTVHTLTGLPTAAGLYTAQFKATADFVEGNTFAGGYVAKPAGEDTALPDKAFVAGDLVSVVVDVAGKRLGMGASKLRNKNFLHNYDFTDPIIQRRQNLYTEAGYTIDRWRIPANCSLTVNADNVVFKNSTTGNSFRQLIEFPKKFAGRTVTVSFEGEMVTPGAKFAVFISSSDFSPIFGGYITSGIAKLTVNVPTSFSDLWVGVVMDAPESSVKLLRGKFEIGASSTLFLDPPADYEEELRKCQRYCVEINPYGATVTAGFGKTTSTPNETVITIPVPTTMRATPAAVMTGDWGLEVAGTPTPYVVTDIIPVSVAAGVVKVRVITAADPENNQYAELWALSSSARMLLSADL